MVAKAALIILSLMLMGFLSGCTNPLTEANAPGCSAVGLCKVQDKQAEIFDVITIENIEVRPIERIKPNTQVDVIVTLKNNDKNPVNKVAIESIAIDNLDMFSCVSAGSTSGASSSGSSSTTPSTTGTGSSSTAVRCEITGEEMVSGAENAFPFTIRAPAQWGSMALTSSIQVSVKYKYQSTRITSISYLSRETYIDYLNSGTKIATDITNVPSDGPVDAYVDVSKLGQPILYDSSATHQIFLSLTNKGKGEISKIDIGNLKLDFEDGKNTFTKCDEAFGGDTCSGSGSSGSSTSGGAAASTSSISNTQEIRLRGNTKGFNYFLEFQPASGMTFLNDAMATTHLKTTVDYEYIIRQKKEIAISPNAQV